MTATLKISEGAALTVRIEIEESGKSLFVELPPRDIGMIAGALLEVAGLVSRADNRPAVGKESDWKPVRASHVSLGPSPFPKCHSMVLGFGDAQIGVSIGESVVAKLGQALIALSAQGKPT